ncbi:MAG: aminopeptidase P N-terminal domain-containing protein [Bacteroidales bacterium]|nr:aminopeptidase P N-terminal domain-containing protein [Bacteroidales bacterium]
MRYKPIDPDLFITNRLDLVKRLKPNSLAVINSNDQMPRNGDQDFVFRQNSDLFYLTGLDQEKCMLVLCPDHPLEAMREVAFIPNVSSEQVIWYGKKYSLDDAKMISGIKTIKYLDEFGIVFKDMMTRVECVYLNQNEYPKYLTEVPYRDLRFAQQLRHDYPAHPVERLAPLLLDLRLVKKPAEIDLISKANNITGKAFRRVLTFIKPGMMEYEIEAEITNEFIRNGASGHAYPPIIASGADACILHYNINNKSCKDGDLILMDFGAEYANYAADCTRTVPANGKFSPRQLECYNAVLRVLKKSIKMLVPGVTIDQVQVKVCALIDEECMALGLYTEEDKNKSSDKPLYLNYFMHGVSHFLGLDVHDVGNRQVVLQKGMVLTCEPAIYIEKEGIGIRLENDIVVDEVPVDLMADIPLEAGEIEALMKKFCNYSDDLKY